MSRPIKLTEKIKKEITEDFLNSLKNFKFTGSSFSFNKKIETNKDESKAKILFTPVAYVKMIYLINHFSSEVAWHGCGHRSEDNPDHFIIEDIVVYPQEVSGSTVSMDPEKYTDWIIENIKDERMNNIIMQGHSHVNFETHPSGVDLNSQEQIVAQLKDDSYYIFMIWNKKMEHTTCIYDLANNIYYDNADIEYGMVDLDNVFSNFVKEIKKYITTKAPTGFNSNVNRTENKTEKFTNNGWWDTYGYYHQYDTKKSTKEKNKSKKEKMPGLLYDYYDDYYGKED